MSVFKNSKPKKLVTGTSSADSITNSADKVTIDAGKGNDTIHNGGGYVSINGGDGNDVIFNFRDWNVNHATILGGKGNDTVYNDEVGTVFVWNKGDGNDFLTGFHGIETFVVNGENFTTLQSGEDLLIKIGKNIVTIAGSATSSPHIVTSTKNLKAVNDIYNEKSSISIKCKTDRPNYVRNFGNKVTIKGGDFCDLINTQGNNVYVSSGKEQDRINNCGNKVTIDAGADDDSIFINDGNSVSVNGGAGNDYIENRGGKYVTILGGNGNDSVENFSSFVTINGGNGNDFILNAFSSNISMSGGVGDDILVTSEGDTDITITGGTGNDSIYNNAGENILLKYTSGDGNDYVSGFNSTSTLQIGGGAYSTTKSGKNIIVTVGEGKITLVGAASLDKINIKGTKLLTVTDKTTSPVTVDATTKIIDASTRKIAVKITGNGLANTIIGGSKNDSLYGRAGNDSIVGNAGNDKLYGSDGDDILVGGKGNDTLWGDAGNDKLYGGDGKDIFIYKPNEGTDTIFDYQSGDMLKILKSNGKDDGTFTSSTFKNGTLTLSISGGGKILFDGVSKGDKININGTIHTITKNSLS